MFREMHRERAEWSRSERKEHVTYCSIL